MRNMANLIPELYNIHYRGIVEESLLFGITCEYNDRENEYLLEQNTARRHYHPYYELTLVCSGSVLFDVNNKLSQYTVGMIHLVRPQDHHTMFRTGPLQYICLKFYRDIIAPEIVDLLDASATPLIIHTEEQAESYIAEAQHLCTLYTEAKSSLSQPELLQLELRLKTQLFLIRFVNAWQKTHYVPQQHERKISCIHKALAYIHDHFSENITLSHAAEAAEISPNYLSSVFSSEMQMTFWNYLTKCRLEKARIMIMDTDYLISQIAYACGYQSYDGFIKAFKKQYNVSPTEYRNTLKCCNTYTISPVDQPENQ